DKTLLKEYSGVCKENLSGRNIKYGVREFGMAAIAAGMAQTGHILPFIGTFLTFSDYMRNAIRLISLMELPVIFVFTHDSIFLGEDGPTHQPIEQIMSLRLIPGLQLIRPGCAEEVKLSWILAMRHKGPTAIVLPRKSFGKIPITQAMVRDMCCGGYLYWGAGVDKCDLQFFATGTELALACEAAELLERDHKKKVSVISLPCWTVFEQQSESYRMRILQTSAKLIVSFEAGSSLGWERYTGRKGLHISIDKWGASGSEKELRHHYEFTADKVVNKILDSLNMY
ncbi:transketolase-like TK C-terminal-containing protein, partial [Candidatus Similichlamydia epinepheli]|uniref:transketolase-like TK C-terminal-containing protein n=1 Tax=Candidatus Similichlamydia epinepheli TaxID=1903953 RepID=UPI003B967C57